MSTPEEFLNAIALMDFNTFLNVPLLKQAIQNEQDLQPFLRLK